MTNTICEHCGESFHRSPAHKKRSDNFFCSRDCYRSHQRCSPVRHVLESHDGYELWNATDTIVRVHQLTAIADGADPYDVFGDNQLSVHHENGCPIDNRPSNLSILSRGENAAEAQKRRSLAETSHVEVLDMVESFVAFSELTTSEATTIIENEL